MGYAAGGVSGVFVFCRGPVGGGGGGRWGWGGGFGLVFGCFGGFVLVASQRCSFFFHREFLRAVPSVQYPGGPSPSIPFFPL